MKEITEADIVLIIMDLEHMALRRRKESTTAQGPHRHYTAGLSIGAGAGVDLLRRLLKDKDEN